MFHTFCFAVSFCGIMNAEAVIDWHNNVALMMTGERTFRFVNTETSLSSPSVVADRVQFLRFALNGDDDIFCPSVCFDCVILCLSCCGGKLTMSAFHSENPFRPVLIQPNATIEVRCFLSGCDFVCCRLKKEEKNFGCEFFR
jgi:hypothetical protein